MKRTKHSLSYYKLATLDMGQLVPVACLEVLPGDSFQHSSSCLLRVSPLVAPVMHPVTVRIHSWFVPNRLLWDGWEEFITGGPDGEGGASGAYPVIDTGAGASFAAGELADYFGIPPGVNDLEVSALPFRAYNLIYNEFYRDQDLVTALVVPKTSGADTTSPREVQNIAWEKDYFTSARPWPQKGPEVTLPLGTVAPVRLNANVDNWQVRLPNGTLSGAADLASDAGGGLNNIGSTQAYKLDPRDTLEVDLSLATSVNVNTVREAFAVQRYEEARAQYGSRYTEYLRYLGIRSSDARLQRPEYLGGGKQTISFSEILQTGPDASDDEGVGRLKGHGIAALRTRPYRRFFEEHGYVISLMSVRPRTMYADGIHRSWSRRTKEEYWQKELELIGQQEIRNEEIYADAADPEGVFGYQDRYAEYRHLPSTVAGDFRTTLDFWHMARLFAAEPALNADFVTCDPTKRIHAVSTNDVLWCMISNNISARRMLGRRTIGRIM